MWLIHDDILFNLSCIERIYVTDNILYFIGNDLADENGFFLTFEDEKKAKQNLKYIQQALSQRQDVVYL